MQLDGGEETIMNSEFFNQKSLYGMAVLHGDGGTSGISMRIDSLLRHSGNSLI